MLDLNEIKTISTKLSICIQGKMSIRSITKNIETLAKLIIDLSFDYLFV